MKLGTGLQNESIIKLTLLTLEKVLAKSDRLPFWLLRGGAGVVLEVNLRKPSYTNDLVHKVIGSIQGICLQKRKTGPRKGLMSTN